MSRFLVLPWRRVDAHEQVQGLLSAYIDGGLSGRERRMLEDHVARCTTCREDLEGLRATVNLMRRVLAVRPPRQLTLVAPQRRSLGLVPWPLPTASVTAGLLLAFIVAADVTGVLPQSELPAVPSTPPQARGAVTEPSAGGAIPAASAPAPRASTAPLEDRAPPAVIEALGMQTGPEDAPTPVRGPEDGAGPVKTPWRFVEAALSVITLALVTLWARKARRGAWV